MMFRSLTGGTGSGLSSVLMKRVNEDFVKKTCLSLDILPTFQVLCVILTIIYIIEIVRV